jgi:hypothetical protein
VKVDSWFVDGDDLILMDVICDGIFSDFHVLIFSGRDECWVGFEGENVPRSATTETAQESFILS